MTESLRTLKDADLDGKRVLLRLDLNVPMDEKGNITDDTRIQKSLPTIKHLLSHGAKVVILTHLGRPKGKIVEDLRVDAVSEALTKLLGQKVKKLHECIGPEVAQCVEEMSPGEVCMLENTRFYHGEETNDESFAEDLAKLADVYVSDAFGTVHRSHASTVGVANLLPSYAGLLLEKEIRTLSALLSKPEKPLTLVVGGAKIGTKIGLLVNFLEIADNILIGGALSNTFLCAQGFEIGDSLCEYDKASVARDFLGEAEKQGEKVLVPIDVVAADDIAEDADTLDLKVDSISPGMKILDIGKITSQKFVEVIKNSKTIIWNGPMGLYELSPFEGGTRAVAEAIAESNANTIIGGGDTIDAVKKFGIDENHFTHISTGGGAMLEFLQGSILPGISVLQDK